MSDIIQKWIRKCDECGHTQEDKSPDVNKEPTTAYNFRKCKKCKSESLDYGTYRFYNEVGEEVNEDTAED